MSKFLVHPSPVWRDLSNYILQLLVDAEACPDEFEQVWTALQEDGSHVLCCIPFFLYGLSLGDQFEKLPSGSFRILSSSGRITIRVWMADATPLEKANLVKQCQECGCLIERSSENLIALDCENADRANAVQILLGKYASEGKIQYELANPVIES